MSEMIERVARAICCPGRECAAACEAPLMYCQITHNMPSARAAIAAMREPTEAMFDAGGAAEPFGEPMAHWNQWKRRTMLRENTNTKRTDSFINSC